MVTLNVCIGSMVPGRLTFCLAIQLTEMLTNTKSMVVLPLHGNQSWLLEIAVGSHSKEEEAAARTEEGLGKCPLVLRNHSLAMSRVN